MKTLSSLSWAVGFLLCSHSSFAQPPPADTAAGAAPSFPAEPVAPRPAPAQPTAAPAATPPATSFAATPSANPVPVAQPPHAPNFSIALERAAALTWGSISPQGADDASVTHLTIGGPISHPLAMPRLGLDYILAVNLALGAGVGLTSGRFGVSDQTFSGTLVYLEPRLGYRIPVSESFDLTPRAGLGLAFGSGTYETSVQDCVYGPGYQGQCTETTEENHAALSAQVLSLEGVLTFRATDSLNLLSAVALDTLLGASGHTSRAYAAGSNPGSSTPDTSYDGGMYTVQLWFGIGGYL